MSDRKAFALKYFVDLDKKNLNMVMQEARLIAYLNSDEMVQCHELFYFNKKVFVILEFMDQGSMEGIVTQYHENFTQNFCRYTLYKVAMGLSKMHRANVLHRDIKSDNILYSSDG